MIAYQGARKRYDAVVAMDDVDLCVREGEVLALIGPNGCGKTTTLKAALGLVRPDAGRVTVGGLDVAKQGREARAALGYLPQRLSFPDGCSAREVLRFYGRLRGADARDDAALLERVGLADAAERPVDTFSGGMRQRLGIAVALLDSPRALVLDEPSASLDPSGALLVRDILAGLRVDGMTVLLSSHDLAEVAAVADRVAILVAGRVVALGSVPDLVRDAGGAPADLEKVYRAATSRPPLRVA